MLEIQIITESKGRGPEREDTKGCGRAFTGEVGDQGLGLDPAQVRPEAQGEHRTVLLQRKHAERVRRSHACPGKSTAKLNEAHDASTGLKFTRDLSKR